MKAGVCSYCFNALLSNNELTLMDMVAFVGKETEADCFEPLTRFWDADRVVHVHAKDFHRRTDAAEGWMEIPSGEYIKRAVGGEGDMNWPEIFGILHRAGYTGTISLEVSDPADLHGSVAKGVANIKRLISEIAD